jgi:hypothetical protein
MIDPKFIQAVQFAKMHRECLERMLEELNFEIMAHYMYDAYGRTAEWLTWDDKPMPQWNDLGKDVKARWIASAIDGHEYAMSPLLQEQVRQLYGYPSYLGQ